MTKFWKAMSTVLAVTQQQLRYWYLAVPMLTYLTLLIIYPALYLYLYSEQQIRCKTKGTLIEFDELVFSWLYNLINPDFNPFLLILSSLPYLLHFATPACYLLYLIVYRKGWWCFRKYLITLGLTSVVSICIEYALPQPPPWEFLDLPPQGKFHVVDTLLQMEFFHKLYGLNKLICGAFPSLHTAWPAVNLFNGEISILMGISHVALIMFAAVYSSHHRVVDVLVGLGMAYTMTRLGQAIVHKIRSKQQFLIANKSQELKNLVPANSNENPIKKQQVGMCFDNAGSNKVDCIVELQLDEKGQENSHKVLLEEHQGK